MTHYTITLLNIAKDTDKIELCRVLRTFGNMTLDASTSLASDLLTMERCYFATGLNQQQMEFICEAFASIQVQYQVSDTEINVPMLYNPNFVVPYHWTNLRTLKKT